MGLEMFDHGHGDLGPWLTFTLIMLILITLLPLCLKNLIMLIKREYRCLRGVWIYLRTWLSNAGERGKEGR